MFSLPGLELRSHGRPAGSLSLYPLLFVDNIYYQQMVLIIMNTKAYHFSPVVPAEYLTLHLDRHFLASPCILQAGWKPSNNPDKITGPPFSPQSIEMT
jgi:hypothetical protein